MVATWKDIYPWMGGAVFNLDSIDCLLSKATAAIAHYFQSECRVWAGLESEASYLCVYSTMGWLDSAQDLEKETGLTGPISEVPDLLVPVQQFHITEPPQWLLQQQENPQPTQTEQGDLIMPVVSRWEATHLSEHSEENTAIQFRRESLQLLIQLKQPEAPAFQTSPALTVPLPEQVAPQHTETWATLEIVASQLSLAYSALYWRQWLEQSRRQAALVGRIAHLLNSTLNADEIVERIVAELGQGLQCDRCILASLRTTPITIPALWDHPERPLPEFPDRRMDRTLWQPVIDRLQEGASYLTIEQSTVQATGTETLGEWLSTLAASSVLLIPLFVQSDFLGAVCLLSYNQERQYSLDELQTVRQVADHAAIALTNAQNYQSLWHKQEALRRQNTTLQMEVIRDELTQLMNRRSLERELDQLSTPTLWTGETTFSMIMCDIDYFKLVNDTYGHRVGDEVLQSLALCLRQQLRRETPAYRYGGEEFVVILTETTLQTAVGVAERLRDAIHNTPIKTSAGAIDLTASFGVTQQDPSRDHHAWDVLQRCDEALYEAKRQGRDRVKAG